MGAFPGSGRGETNDELTRVRRELERVKEERDILKKASAYVAKELQESTHSYERTRWSFESPGCVRCWKSVGVGTID